MCVNFEAAQSCNLCLTPLIHLKMVHPHPHPYAKMKVHTHPSRGSKIWVTKSLKLQLAALGILILENEKNVWKVSRLWDGLSEIKRCCKSSRKEE